MPLTIVERQIVSIVVQRFLDAKEPTSRIFLVKRFKDPDVIEKLTPVILKTGDGERLWPGVLAFECGGDANALRIARRAVEVIIHVLQNLFNDVETQKMDFTIDELETRATGMFNAQEAGTIWLGLYLVQEFRGIHAGLGGDPPNYTFVRIHERIGLLKNIPGAWDRYVASYKLYLNHEHAANAEYKESQS